MAHAQLVNEEKLHANSDFAETRQILPELILRLIRASIQGPKELRAPIQGSVGQDGWDVELNSPVPFDPYVPSGRSFWEIGVGGKVATKATKDYRKRTAQTDPTLRAESTYIVVTPRSAVHAWTRKAQQAWKKRREAQSKWKEIRIIDGTVLAQWIYEFPEVDHWLADQFGIRVAGLSSPAFHWLELKQYGHPPPLSPQIFLSRREIAIGQLKKLFSGEIPELVLQTLYPYEGVDFVSATLASLEPELEATYASRCLIIDDAETWLQMCMLREQHVFVGTPALDLDGAGSDLRHKARIKNHRVVFATTPLNSSHPNSAPLTETSVEELARGLAVSGYQQERARQIANKSGGRIPVLKRLLLSLSASPAWASDDEVSNLALAVLIGRWDGNLEGDRSGVEQYLGKPYGEWIRDIRPSTLYPDPPLIQREEKWHFVSRFEGWQILGPQLSDDDLVRFSALAQKVLSELNPALEMAVEDRWKAKVEGKMRKYSNSMREGISETLALLGSLPESLRSTSFEAPQSTAERIVNQLLSGADWKLWAGLNDVLPLLAEASPDSFLASLEKALEEEGGSPFEELFAQESAGITGTNYLTGLLWALETLAWHSDYLARVVLILGQLAKIDPGGNWSNRPSNSLTAIFLPWYPQTSAPIWKRRKSLEALLLEYPSVGWKLLLDLLPRTHQSSSGTRKPTWRNYVVQDTQTAITNHEYGEQVGAYATVAIDAAKTDRAKLIQLIERIADLPFPASRQLLDYLKSDEVKLMPEEDRLEFWEKLIDVATRHKRYADAKWALKAQDVAELESVAERIEPVLPAQKYRRLFTEKNYALYGEGDDFEKQQRLLEELRVRAIGEVFNGSSIQGVLAFATKVASPGRVGFSFGAIATQEAENSILPECLDSSIASLVQFAGGFVWSRFQSGGWRWFDEIRMDEWSSLQRAIILSHLPFDSEAWERASSLLGTDGELYWQRANANPFSARNNLVRATELLHLNKRPAAAVHCLAYFWREEHSIPIDLAIRVLESLLNSTESTAQYDQFQILEVIQALQESVGVDQQKLARIEWSYLPLLDSHSGCSPRALERLLATSPDFVCEVVATTFRPSHERETKPDSAEQQKARASNAYRLLREWKRPPGARDDRSIEGAALKVWLDAVKNMTKASGHFDVAMTFVGQVLVHSLPDSDGFWPPRDVAKVLNSPDGGSLRDGFTTQLFNLRGARFSTGGAKEREEAAEMKGRAESAEGAGYIRLATAMRLLARTYEREAMRHEKETGH